MLRDLFPDPDAVLFLTRVTQREFIAGVPDRYRNTDGGIDVSLDKGGCGERYMLQEEGRDPSPLTSRQVMMLMDLMSPWVNITYRGCRYMQEARAETLRKYSVLHEYFRELDQLSFFDWSLGPEDEEYVLMSLTREECTPDYKATYEPVAIRGWGRLPGRAVPVPEFGMEETAQTWVTWASDNDRRLRAAVLEWVLMNSTQGPAFLCRIGSNPEFGKVFLGHYHTIEAVMTRLGSTGISPPMFFLYRIERVKQDLDNKEKLLETAWCEVMVREEQSAFLRDILDQACSGELEVLSGYNTRIPALPPWPARRQTRRQPRAAGPSGPDRREARKRKRSLSRAPPAGGVERSAYGRMETDDAA